MAFSESDIETMKSAVPIQFRPRPDQFALLSSSFLTVGATAPTPLKGSENNPDPLTNDKAREWAGLALVGTDAGGGAFMLTGAQLAVQQSTDKKTEEKKRDGDRRLIDQIRDALDRRLAEIETELAGLDTRLDEIRERRAAIGDSLEAVDDLSELIATGKLDANNPAHAALMRRAGVTPEDMRRKDAADILHQRKTTLSGEDTALHTEENHKIRRKAELLAERTEIKAAQADIENADTDEARAKATERAKTALGRRELIGAALQTDRVEAKMIAGVAIGQTENSDVRGASVNMNKLAVSGNLAAVASSDLDSFNLDDPPKSQPSPKP